MWSSQLQALLEKRERKKKEIEGPVCPPVHLCLRSQTSASWGCRLCVGGTRGPAWALGTAVCWQCLPVRWWRLAWTDLSVGSVSILWGRAEWRWVSGSPAAPLSEALL